MFTDFNVEQNMPIFLLVSRQLFRFEMLACPREDDEDNDDDDDSCHVSL